MNSGDKKMPNGILEEQGMERFSFLLSVNFVYAHACSLIKNSVIQLRLLLIYNVSYRIVIEEKIVKKPRRSIFKYMYI